jgi:hypothetical protein
MQHHTEYHIKQQSTGLLSDADTYGGRWFDGEDKILKHVNEPGPDAKSLFLGGFRASLFAIGSQQCLK